MRGTTRVAVPAKREITVQDLLRTPRGLPIAARHRSELKEAYEKADVERARYDISTEEFTRTSPRYRGLRAGHPGNMVFPPTCSACWWRMVSGKRLSHLDEILFKPLKMAGTPASRPPPSNCTHLADALVPIR